MKLSNPLVRARNVFLCSSALLIALTACGGGSGEPVASDAVGSEFLEQGDMAALDESVAQDGGAVMLIEEAARRNRYRNGWRDRTPAQPPRAAAPQPSPAPAPIPAPVPAPATPEPVPPTTGSPTPPPDSSTPPTAVPNDGTINPAHFAFVQGWANTQGGRGGKIVKVTSLAASGPGSLRAAIDTKGPRIIVFEVSGNIDLQGQMMHIREPFVTIAGQTAPSPGITIIRGGLQTHTHDVIMQHLKIRPGSGAGNEVDALETQRGSYNVVVDHCSFSWGTDEVLSAAGYAFSGNNLAEWRAATSNRITFSHNIIAEPISSGHQFGTLVEDNATQILLYGNYYAHNKERSPNFGGGTQGAAINNLIYNGGSKMLDYTLNKANWGSRTLVVGKLTAIGNVGRAGPQSNPKAFFETVSNGNVEYYPLDNIATRADGSKVPDMTESSYLNNPQGRILLQSTPPVMPPGVTPRPASSVEQWIHQNVGARPWDRDEHDKRVLNDHLKRTGRMITSQDQVGGYPANVVRSRPFNPDLWDLDTMTPLTAAAL